MMLNRKISGCNLSAKIELKSKNCVKVTGSISAEVAKTSAIFDEGHKLSWK